MKKFRKILNENRVLIVLGIILLVCLIVVAVVSLVYFYGSSDTVYGNRLDSIKDLPLNNKLFDNIKNELKSEESVEKVDTILKGKIVYININFAPATKMEDAKTITTKALSLFSDEELSGYDIEFTISSAKADDFVGYTLMGARNANGIGEIVWNNYNIEVDEEVE